MDVIPLTHEEETKFRESVRLLHGSEPLQWSNHAAARLLATLDAERVRAAVVAPEINVVRLARSLALIGPVDVGDDMVGWNAYAVDISCTYGSKDVEDDAPDWRPRPTATCPGPMT